MIRPNSRFAVGALLLCVAASGWSEETKNTVTPSTPTKPQRTSKPQPILPPSNAEQFGGGYSPVLRPEGTTRLIPVVTAQSRPLPLPEATAPKEPALPTKVVPKPADAKSAAPMTAKTGEKPAPATRVGRTGLREDDEVPIPSVTPLKEDDTLRRKPTAIDPKEMAPMDGKNGRVRPIRPVSGAVVSPETALSATSLKQESILTPDFVRKGALSAGMSERLADQMAAIILGDSGQKEAITIGKDRWVLEACQSLNEYPEGERAAAFQEILRVYQRRRAAEETAKAKRE